MVHAAWAGKNLNVSCLCIFEIIDTSVSVQSRQVSLKKAQTVYIVKCIIGVKYFSFACPRPSCSAMWTISPPRRRPVQPSGPPSSGRSEVKQSGLDFLFCSVADPDLGSGAFLTPGSGNHDVFFGLKYLNSLRIRDGKNSDPGWKKVGSWIRYKHPGSVTLLFRSVGYRVPYSEWLNAYKLYHF